MQVNDENRIEVFGHDGPVLIKFFAPWCKPCTRYAPTVDLVRKGYPQVKYVEVNIDNAPEMARIFNVRKVPCLGMVKSGDMMGILQGTKPAEEIVKYIDSNIS